MWFQKKLSLAAKKRGFHLVTAEVISQLPEIKNVSIGILNLFIQHTSASITLNENADPDVRVDMESHFNQIVPENAPYYIHTVEGPDDMPAHIKSSLLGNVLSIPITDGQLNLGTWQGIYMCEHRNHASSRRFVATVTGEG